MSQELLTTVERYSDFSKTGLKSVFRKKYMPKKLEDIKQTVPVQLRLFQILTETDVLTDDGNKLKTGRNYSQTIELIDFMPRFVWGHQKDLRKEYNGLLPVLQREFESRGTRFRLEVKAAVLVDDEKKSIAYYPGPSEDLLEVVLRRMFLDDPTFYDGLPGVKFTVNQIRAELKAQGHTRSHSEILRSLEIMQDSNIRCQNLDTDAKLAFRVIDALYLSAEKSPNDCCYLTFSKPYAEALEGLYFRRFNYKQVVRYKSNFARLLHRRISHHYTQANHTESPYTVNLTTLIRDFGFQYQNLTKAVYDLEDAVKEMKEAKVISTFSADKIIDSTNPRKIQDYFLEITPTKNFSFEASGSNKITNRVKEYNFAYNNNNSETTKVQFLFPDEVNENEFIKKVSASDSEEISDKFGDVLPVSLMRKKAKVNNKKVKEVKKRG